MTDATGGTPNPADASATNTGAPAATGTLLTDGNPAQADAKPAADPAAKADDGAANKDADGAKAPESYEFKMPEGVELDTAAAAEFSVIAKELKLDNATAQKIADVAVKMQQKQAERDAETVKGWVEQSKADKEFGGDNLQQNLAVAQKAIDTFGSESLKEMLKKSGLGNHPDIIRFAFKAGKAISEDTFRASGNRAATSETSLEKRLYPGMN